MISYRKFNLIRETFEEYFKTTDMLIDVNSVSTRSKNKLSRYIYKALKKKLKEIDREDKYYQKRLKKQFKLFKPTVFDNEVTEKIKDLLLEAGLLQLPKEEVKEDVKEVETKTTTPDNVEKPAKEEGPAEESENPEEPAQEEAENVEKPTEETTEEKSENPEQTSKPETPEECPKDTETEEIDVENDVSE